jgi:hypothetical protein
MAVGLSRGIEAKVHAADTRCVMCGPAWLASAAQNA